METTRETAVAESNPVNPNREQDRDEPTPEPWRRRFVPGFLKREKLAGQIVRFGMVGGLNTGVDFALLLLLYNGLGAPLLVANTVSYSGGIVNSFLWNKYWTFSAGASKRWKHELFVFLAVSLSALAVNDLAIYLMHLALGDTSVASTVAKKAVASLVSMTWNFLGYRFLAFRSSAPRREA